MYRFFVLIMLLSVGNNLFAIKPERKYVNSPRDYGLNYEEKLLKTDDSCQVFVWHLLPTEGKVKNISIVVSSSDAGNMNNWLAVAGNLASMGYDVWMYDYRGFGESCDFEIQSNMLYYNEFVADLTAVVNAVKTTQKENKICLMGFSMGSIINMLYIASHRQMIDYYIAEGHVYCPELLAAKLTNIGKNIVVPTNSLFASDCRDIYAHLQTSVLLFCAKGDIVCDADDLNKLSQHLPTANIIEYEGKHLTGFQVLQFDYLTAIDNFLSSHQE